MTEQPDWMTPDPWESHGEATRRGLARTPEERRQHRLTYLRDYRRRQRRGTDAEPVGWLHELRCEGNHHGHAGCKPIPVYR